MIGNRLKGGVLIAHPSTKAGEYIVAETNIKDRRLVPGNVITSKDITSLVSEGATVLVSPKERKAE